MVRPLLAAFVAALLAPVAEADFIAVGTNDCRLVSSDGIVWQEDVKSARPPSFPATDLIDIAFGGHCFVAVGSGPLRGRICSRCGPEGWMDAQPDHVEATAIAFGEEKFVAMHGGQLLVSTDGRSFQLGESVDPANAGFRAIRSAFGNGEAGSLFVVIGDRSMDSKAGVTFWRANSADGKVFLSKSLNAAPANDLIYGAGLFVTVGPHGLIESSHDGQTWTRQRCDTPEDLLWLVWTGKRFMAGSLSGLWSSKDGAVWTREPFTIPGKLAWAKEDQAKSFGIALSPAGELLTSENFSDWKRANYPPGSSLRAVAASP